MKDLYYILLIVLITLILSGAGEGAVKGKRNKNKKFMQAAYVGEFFSDFWPIFVMAEHL